jgi:hypothetical protein
MKLKQLKKKNIKNLYYIIFKKKYIFKNKVKSLVNFLEKNKIIFLKIFYVLEKFNIN